MSLAVLGLATRFDLLSLGDGTGRVFPALGVF